MVIPMLFYYYDYCLIQNYVKVLKICDEEAIIKMKHYSFILKGCCLKITYFSKEELKIEGNITDIKIEYEEFNQNKN